MTDNSRGAWSNQIQFVLTCIGFSVGLGNIWRFPAMAYENGGAAFLIPYLTCSVLVGLPCLYLEFFIGQSTQSGPSKAFWYCMPALQGVGWTMSLLSLLTGCYYNLVVAWCLRYIFDVITFQSSKWTTCNNYWNSDSEFCQHSIQSLIQTVPFINLSMDRIHSDKPITGSPGPETENSHFRHRLFNMSATMDQYGMFNWEMFVALLIAWIITCLSIIKGVSVIGKISFLTATLPYVIIVIMFIRGVTMDGAKTGIDYYLLKPDMSAGLYEDLPPFLHFSLEIGFGGLLALASYNKKDHNCFRDAIIVILCDSLMSIIGGVAVFSTLGSLSKSTGKPIDVLFSYDAISTMPVPELFAFLFFFMLFLLGISSQFGESIDIFWKRY
ncbi:unnamed protein product [Haemonchus placei]|uniref:Transporter n=1 Tax=Haemonchus placei TaxID=6290 RepID=A0A0N4WJ88_HAEPC|nr:unnamed protein product [Haemonchus placei]